MSDRILVVFEGGPKNGESQWWIGGNYIEVAPIIPYRQLEEMPDRATITRYTYRIDAEPQPGGSYIARLVS